MRGLIPGLPSPHPLSRSMPGVYQRDESFFVGSDEPGDRVPVLPPPGVYVVEITEESLANGVEGSGADVRPGVGDLLGRWIVQVWREAGEQPLESLHLAFRRGGDLVATGSIALVERGTISIVSSQCGRAPGRYRWSFDGTLLGLVAVDDPCASRRALLTTRPLERRNLTMRMMDAFDEALAPVIASLDNLDAYVDPRFAPEDFVDWLCTWVAFSPRRDAPLARRRAHVQTAVRLLRAWSTVEGIRAFVSIFAGVGADQVEIEENGGVASSANTRAPLPGAPEPRLKVRVRVAEEGGIDAKQLDRLVSIAKPAHMPHEVEVVAG